MPASLDYELHSHTGLETLDTNVDLVEADLDLLAPTCRHSSCASTNSSSSEGVVSENRPSRSSSFSPISSTSEWSSQHNDWAESPSAVPRLISSLSLARYDPTIVR